MSINQNFILKLLDTSIYKKMLVTITLLLSLFVSISSLKEIPERARGGRAYQTFASKYTSTSSSKVHVPLTWQAKVDNFDKQNNNTYSQRYYVDDSYWAVGTGEPK